MPFFGLIVLEMELSLVFTSILTNMLKKSAKFAQKSKNVRVKVRIEFLAKCTRACDVRAA
jgi:hypothetical protein